MVLNNRNIKSLKLKTIINTERDEQELELAFSEVGIFRLWRSEIKPTYCVISSGLCKLGVMKYEYDRYNYEEASVQETIDRILDAKIKDSSSLNEVV